MLIEKNIVMYDNFKILKQLYYCSFVEYMTIYGEKNHAIISNELNRILYNINNYSLYTDDNDINKVLDEQERSYYVSKKKRISQKFTDLKSEYCLNEKEYIIGIPYEFEIDMFLSYVIKISPNIVESIHIINDRTSRDRRMSLLPNYKKNGLLFYKSNNIVKELSKIASSILRNNIFDKEFLHEKAIKPTKRKINKKQITKIQNQDIHDYAPISLQVPSIITTTPSTEIEREELSTKNQINKDVIYDDYDAPNISRGNLEPEKKLRTFTATNRNLTIVKYLKDLYQNKCQICGETIEVSPGNFLSEVHHIRPLGEHDGADVIENMIVLCPNHHTMFDRGSITIDLDKKVVIHFNHDNPLNNKQIRLKHEINSNYLDYHSKKIFFSSDQVKHQKASCQIKIINEIGIPESLHLIDFGSLVTLIDIKTEEIFNIKLEAKYNKEFMKPLEKKSLGKCLNSTIEHNGFYYRVIKIKPSEC